MITRRRFIVAVASGLIAGATPATAAGLSAEVTRRLRDLRDEGLRNIGWIAGNAEGHPVWPRIRQYVGKDGDYYDFFVRLAPIGGAQLGEAWANIDLYEKWVEVGRVAAYDEAEAARRVRRTLAIIDELRALLESLR